MIPSIWRTELLHPLAVHLPIGLLIFGSLCGLIVETSRLRAPSADHSAVLNAFIIPGAPLAWIAILTGGWAEDVVNRKICDPTVTANHEEMAYIAAYIFTAAAVTLLLRAPILRKVRSDTLPFLSRTVSILLIALFGSGALFLVQTSHLGATLVYQQAAGVYQPSPECTEFE